MRIASILFGVIGFVCATLLMLPSIASAGRFPAAPLLALTETAEPPTPLPDTPVPATPVPPTLVPSTPTAVPETPVPPVPPTATPTRRRGGDAQDEPTATPTAEPTLTPEPTATEVPVSPTAEPTATPAVVARTRPSRLPPTGASDDFGIAMLLACAFGSLVLGLRARRVRQ